MYILLLYPKAGTDCRWLHSAVMEGARLSLSNSLTHSNMQNTIDCSRTDVSIDIPSVVYHWTTWRITTPNTYGHLMQLYINSDLLWWPHPHIPHISHHTFSYRTNICANYQLRQSHPLSEDWTKCWWRERKKAFFSVSPPPNRFWSARH